MFFSDHNGHDSEELAVSPGVHSILTPTLYFDSLAGSYRNPYSKEISDRVNFETLVAEVLDTKVADQCLTH